MPWHAAFAAGHDQSRTTSTNVNHLNSLVKRRQRYAAQVFADFGTKRYLERRGRWLQSVGAGSIGTVQGPALQAMQRMPELMSRTIVGGGLPCTTEPP